MPAARLFLGVCGLCVALAMASFSPARADEPNVIRVRVGNHPGFGRVVFDLPPDTKFALAREGNRVRLVFPAGESVLVGNNPPRNVRAIEGGAGTAVLELTPGTKIRTLRLGDRLALDVLDPPRPTRPAASRTPPAPAAPAASAPPAPANPPTPQKSAEPAAATQPPAAQSSGPELPSASPILPVEAAELAAEKHAAPRPPPTIAPADFTPPKVETVPAQLSLAVARVQLPPGALGSAIALPFGNATGAAAFRRDGLGMVVFDERRPIDLASMQGDPVFGDAKIQLFPSATVLTLPLSPREDIALVRIAGGWVVNVVPGRVALHPIPLKQNGTSIDLLASAPGNAVSVPDPETGGDLLVGTERQSGEGILTQRRAPEFSLLPSFQGVVVVPFSDRLSLRTTTKGFALSAGGGKSGGLAISAIGEDPSFTANADAMTRSFDFAPIAPESLFQQFQAEIDIAAATPPLARLKPRKQAAETLIAMGLGAEAQALLRLAVTDDPRGANDPQLKGLSAVGAILAGRLAEAGGIDDPHLAPTDELLLWRAARTALAHEGDPSAASGFAATFPLILNYPEALRRRLLPLAAETMVLGGKEKIAAQLLQKQQDDPTLVFARALLAEKEGKTKEALAVYDRLAVSRDRLARARAAVRAVELRLRNGEFSPAQAAELEDRLIYAWRGDQRELDLRLRVAELRSQAGQWRQALALLRETENLFPDHRDAIRTRLEQTFTAFQQGGKAAQLSALDLVALIEENADLLPNGPAGEAIVAEFADRLAALDLLEQADPVLERLLRMAKGGARAEFGARLAKLRLEMNNPEGALAALHDSEAEGLSPALAEERGLLLARALAAKGETSAALAQLASLNTASADEARAAIFEAAKDWKAAESALYAFASKTIPAEKPISAQAAGILVRLASDAAQAGDETMLAILRQTYGARLPAGTNAEIFRVLTESPVQSIEDLPRAAAEMTEARAMAEALTAPAPSAH
jgi:hypothetical protein